jgi:hypothetical protein
VSAFLLILVVTGCSVPERRAAPVNLPNSIAVDRIEIHRTSGLDKQARAIVDRERIDRFVKFINGLDSGWTKPCGTFPVRDWTVAATRDGEQVAVFWSSRGSIGGRRAGEQNRQRPLSADEWRVLKSILEFDDD